MTEWEGFQLYLDYIKAHYNSMKTWSDKDKMQETVFAIEKEIQRLRNKGVIS